MELYKYKSLDNLWHVLDIIINKRIYCAEWKNLNDPMEGLYDPRLINLYDNGDAWSELDKLKVASLSSCFDNHLMWSHYADGHKGIAIEVEIDENDDHLYDIKYDYGVGCNSFFDGNPQEVLRHKIKEFIYEEEYRVIQSYNYFSLKKPIMKIFYGVKIDTLKLEMLKRILPKKIEFIEACPYKMMAYK